MCQASSKFDQQVWRNQKTLFVNVKTDWEYAGLPVMRNSSNLEVKRDHSQFISESGVPRHLYKFRSWNDEHHRKLLEDQIVWFASPASFNDPFDCKIHYQYDKMPQEEKTKRVHKLAKEQYPDWDNDRLHRETRRILDEHPVFSSDANLRKREWKKWGELLARYFGILSFAGCIDNILLWSHYSDFHRGFCVKIDGHLLAEQLFDLIRTDNHAVDFQKVQYQEMYPVVIPTNDSDEDLDRFKRLLTIKSLAWQHENEYRFIYIRRTNLARSISKRTIKRVILGCQMSAKDEKEIVSLVTTELPHTEIWRAVKSPDEFKLEFKPMNG